MPLTCLPPVDEDALLAAALASETGGESPQEGSDSGGSQASNQSLRIGDSVCSGESVDTAVAVGGAAVAVDGDRPPCVVKGGMGPKGWRQSRPPRDTTPKEPQWPSAFYESSAFPDFRSGGRDQEENNVGWLFGNWGKFPQRGQVRDRVDLVLKKQPAMIIGLAECDAKSEANLRLPSNDEPQSKVAESFEDRDSFEYLTLRGIEQASLLLGVRARSGNDLTLLHWDRRFEG